MYEYKARVTDVYDGDTITVDIDLGLGVWLHSQKIRLYGIDTPELRGKEREAGLIVRDIVQRHLLSKEITLQTIKDRTGKYGRWLGIVILEKGTSFNQWLLDEGHAKAYLY